MKRSYKDEIVVHYIPEVYNDNIDRTTGCRYGWICAEPTKKPYTTKSGALAALDRPLYEGVKKRVRIETFKCTSVKFENVGIVDQISAKSLVAYNKDYDPIPMR